MCVVACVQVLTPPPKKKKIDVQKWPGRLLGLVLGVREKHSGILLLPTHTRFPGKLGRFFYAKDVCVTCGNIVFFGF